MIRTMTDDEVKASKAPTVVYDPDMDVDYDREAYADDEEMDHDEVYDVDSQFNHPGNDEEIEEHQNKFKRSLMCDEEYVHEVPGPDLMDYFGRFDISEQQEIAICRTYANYLAQKVRSRNKQAFAKPAPKKARK